MSDENKTADTVDNKPDGDVAKLTEQLEELKKSVADRDARLAELESIKEDAIKTRQAAKEREQKALEEQGQFKTIAEMQKEELEKLKTELAERDKTLDEFKPLKADADAWKAYQTERRETLLKELPEGSREKWENAPLQLIEEAVAMIGGNAGVSKAAPSRTGVDGTKKWSEMSNEERRRAGETLDPDKLAQIMKS